MISVKDQINALKIRIHILENRDSVGNSKIIKKLKRRISLLDN